MKAIWLSAAAMACLAVAFSAAMLRARGVEPRLAWRAPDLSGGEGRTVFLQHCSPCHGERGDGRGPSARTMRPPPRDFTAGRFKFGGTGHGRLPSDAALRRVITRGLEGTPMRGWDLSPAEVDAVIAYLKTLSPRWREEERAPELTPSADPFAGRDDEAIALGAQVFSGGAGCALCHAKEPGLKDSAYGVKVFPTVFGFHRVKTAPAVSATYTAAMQREDLYRVIASGVGDAAMPGYRDVIAEEQLWALAHYVQSISY